MNKITISEFLTQHPVAKKARNNPTQSTTRIAKLKKRLIEEMQNPLLAREIYINLRPLSSHEAFRRNDYFSQKKEYREYQALVIAELPIISELEKDYMRSNQFELNIEFGVKYYCCDVTKLIQVFSLIINDFYNFQARVIFKTIIVKKVGDKEYTKFNLKKLQTLGGTV